MGEFLSQEWLDELSAAGGSEGSGGADTDAGADGGTDPAGSAVVQHVVNGAPGGNVSYWTKVQDGRVVEAGPGEAEKPDLTFTLAYEDALRLEQGEVEPSAAYMQGRLKAEGDMVKLFAFLSATHETPT